MEKQHLYPEDLHHRMTPGIVETTIRKYLSTPQPEWIFIWQGGEPTLMGRRFFSDIIKFQQLAASRRDNISNALQTNGTLLDRPFAEVLKNGRFLVGLSLDGPAELHDLYRKTLNDGGTHAFAVRGLQTLQKVGVEHNVLTVVSKANVEYPTEVYEHLRNLGVLYHQYIPCVEFEPDGTLRPFSITGEEWGNFLKGLFNAWQRDDIGRVSVRNFDSVISIIRHNQPITCSVGTHCRNYFVVEYNGDVYPCDFYVQPELWLGNVMTDHFEQMWRSSVYRDFGRRKKRWNEKCMNCEYLRFCAGDCPRNRSGSYNSPEDLSVLCPGWKAFFSYAADQLSDIANGFTR
jgi:uncharacterized protein